MKLSQLPKWHSKPGEAPRVNYCCGPPCDVLYLAISCTRIHTCSKRRGPPPPFKIKFKGQRGRQRCQRGTTELPPVFFSFSLVTTPPHTPTPAFSLYTNKTHTNAVTSKTIQVFKGFFFSWQNLLQMFMGELIPFSTCSLYDSLLFRDSNTVQ